MKRFSRGQMQALLDLALEQSQPDGGTPLARAIEKLQYNIHFYDTTTGPKHAQKLKLQRRKKHDTHPSDACTGTHSEDPNRP